jgi:hypothetical protein
MRLMTRLMIDKATPCSMDRATLASGISERRQT